MHSWYPGSGNHNYDQKVFIFWIPRVVSTNTTTFYLWEFTLTVSLTAGHFIFFAFTISLMGSLAGGHLQLASLVFTSDNQLDRKPDG